MQQKKLEGIATICEDGGFSFDSGLPASEPVLEFEVKPHHGLMMVAKNGSATFDPENKVCTPPVMDEVLRDKNLIVRRTTRNFVVQMKFPIIEAADATNKSHTAMWKKVAAAVKDARSKIKDEF